MQSNEPQRPDTRDLELFDQINEWVRRHPQHLAETGKFLDEAYSERALRIRDIEKWKEAREHGWPRDRKRKPSKLARYCIATHDLLAQFSGIYPETGRDLSNPDDWNQPPNPWSVALGLTSNPKSFDVMRREDRVRIAKLVLLLTWLATEPDADRLDRRITSLQDWAWGDKGQTDLPDSTKSKRPSSGLEAPRISSRSILLTSHAEAWFELVYISWSICSEMQVVSPVAKGATEVTQTTELPRGQNQLECLQALIELKATCAKNGISRSKVADKAFGVRETRRDTMAKEALKILKKQGFTNGTGGRSAKCWATPRGINAINVNGG